MRFPFPILVGDIGGTNARFAVITDPDGTSSEPVHRITHAFASFEAVVADVIAGSAVRPRSLIACAAGPVEGRRIQLTNADWLIDGGAVARSAGLEQGLILNDFEAQALALPAMKPDWVRPIGNALPRSQGARLVLGPGTGLGAAALIEIDNKHFALTSEAGHVDFGPVGSEEAAIWPHLPLSNGRISAETILSGPGLLRLHNARLAARGLVAPRLEGSAFVERAKADHGSAEADTARLFWRLAAGFAGDMALALLATGGVTFSGGMLPRLADLLDVAAFRARFEDKAPFVELLHAISTDMIVVDDVVLVGLGQLAAHPERYAIDYGRRAWC